MRDFKVDVGGEGTFKNARHCSAWASLAIMQEAVKMMQRGLLSLFLDHSGAAI